MGNVALVVGATGLVGRQLVRQLLDDKRFLEVKTFVRHPSGFGHPKLNEYLIDFDHPEKWKELLAGDVLFSTLGTTLKTAGSKEKQYMVDYTYQYRFAELAAQNGVSRLVLVSSAGANARSSVFYSRMKGQLDEMVVRLPFNSVVILRPSLLDGVREGKRTAERISLVVGRFITRFVLKKYRPIPDLVVAKAMVNAALFSEDKMKIVELGDIFELADIDK